MPFVSVSIPAQRVQMSSGESGLSRRLWLRARPAGPFPGVEPTDAGAPLNLCHKLLHNWLIEPALGKGPVVLEVARRGAGHIRDACLRRKSLATSRESGAV